MKGETRSPRMTATGGSGGLGSWGEKPKGYMGPDSFSSRAKLRDLRASYLALASPRRNLDKSRATLPLLSSRPVSLTSGGALLISASALLSGAGTPLHAFPAVARVEPTLGMTGVVLTADAAWNCTPATLASDLKSAALRLSASAASPPPRGLLP